MENLAKKILYRNDSDVETEDRIYHYASDFFDNYDPKNKIDAYVSYVVPIDKGTPDLLILREKLLLLMRKHATLTLRSNKEFAQKYSDIFSITKVESKPQIEAFLAYCIFYYFDSLHNDKHLVVGLDYEFHEGKNKLHQIAFFPLRKYKYIFIVDPSLLDSYQMSIYIKTVYTSPLYKITHGSESLDIPYIYNGLLENDKVKLAKFLNFMVDTRFMCDFYKISTNFEDKKCSIYDGLLFFGVINRKKYDELATLGKRLGPIQHVNWNISTMRDDVFRYALYDVIYLRRFVLNIISQAKKMELELAQQLDLIVAITRYVAYEKYGIFDLSNSTKSWIDPLDSYVVESIDKSRHAPMVELYKGILPRIKIGAINLSVDVLLKMDYFKKYLRPLFKRIIYAIIASKYSVFVRKGEPYDTKITYKELFDPLNAYGLNKIVFLLEEFYRDAVVVMVNFF